MLHHLNPVVLVGQGGPSPALVAELGRALLDHELVKVRLAVSNSTEAKEQAAMLSELSGAELVQRIGHTAGFYRAHPDRPTIALPRR